MTQCKGHHGYETAEITLLYHKVLCFLYTVSITSVQKSRRHLEFSKCDILDLR